MPWEDMDAYRAFCKELMADLAPEGPLENQHAQTFCDTQWRLNRARSIEEGMFVIGHMEQPDDFDLGHPQANAAIIAARAFREDSKAFVNLSLYEQRLQRTLKEAYRRLRELQEARKAATPIEKEAPPEKSAAQAAAAEFVYSSPEKTLTTEPAPTPAAAESHQFPSKQAA